MGLAVGLWLWGARESDRVDTSTAATIQHAANAVCSQSPMPQSLLWPTQDLKNAFISSLQPNCEQSKATQSGLEVHVTRGDGDSYDGRATHQATILLAGRALLRLRLVVGEEDRVTVIGWSKP